MGEPIFWKSKEDSAWRGKYKSLKEYYECEYDPKYFSFDKYQLEIDPDEPMENAETYDETRRQKEIIKCCHSFTYFCHKYVKILHPMKGLIPFILYGYQHKVINDYNNYRFNIISKFRQGGLTTVTLLWGLWRCLFQLDQQIMLLSKADKEATDIGMIIDRAVEHLPEWLAPDKKAGKWNDHLKMFTETGSAIKFHSPVSARGKAVTFLIVDEAAFIPDMETHWKAMWPVLSTGGSCTLVSTVNGIGNWYHQVYVEAKENRNRFHIIDLDYWEHPDYNNTDWVAEQKAQLGEKGFLQEVLREFLGTGDTYFSAKIIRQLMEQTINNFPSRKLFPKWANKTGFVSHIEKDGNRGALWMWKEPVDGHEYIIGADCAEGQGENNDNSSFQIIDTATLEQVAEFYSNTVEPHVFAQILNELGIYYNNAVVAVENMGPGGAVLSNLQHTLFYENLYYEDTKGKSTKPGIRMNQTNRPIFLEALQNRLTNETIRVNSIRFTNELGTFEYNPITKKAQAQKGKHDDSIMAMCIALLVRDSMLRDIPIGAEVPHEILSSVKTQVYEEIKRELLEGRPEDFLAEEEDVDLLGIDKETILPGVVFDSRRRGDRLLKEFGW
jgi:hypothetical protein